MYLTYFIQSLRCTCVGVLDKRTEFTVDSAAFRAMAGGERSLPAGRFGGDTKVTFINADTISRQ